MEHGAKECVEEQSRRETTIAIGVQSAAYIDTEITATNTKEEPGLVGLVKSEPGLLVKEEFVGDGWRDMDGQPCLQATYKPAITTSMNVVAGGVFQDHMKEEWADSDMDVGPTVLQPMDIRYRAVQPEVSIIKQEGRSEDININPTRCSGVKVETIEDEPRAEKDAQRSNKAGQSKQRAQSQLYSCDECVKTYPSKRYLMEHYRNLHSTESHKCTRCNKNFPSKAYLYKHTNYAHSEQRYECAVCKKICTSKKARNKHVHQVHRPRPAGSKPRIYTCDYCKKMFTEKRTMRRHIALVHSSGSYKCHQCNKIFKCKEYLMQHKTNVHTAGSHQLHTCTNCGRNFKSKWHCQRHEKRVKCARPTAGNTSAVASTSRQQHNVKEEPADGELELGPTVFQHMDCNYRPYKQEPQLDLGPVVFQHMDCNYRPYKQEPGLE